jgi:hypothetical protein
VSTILLTLPELPAPVKLTLDLDAEQLLNMDGADVMTASALLVGPDGVGLDLPAVGGRFRHLPESWRDWNSLKTATSRARPWTSSRRNRWTRSRPC